MTDNNKMGLYEIEVDLWNEVRWLTKRYDLSFCRDIDEILVQ